VKLKGFEEACRSQPAFDLQDVTELRFEESAWLAGVTYNLAVGHHELLSGAEPSQFPDFIYSWATCAPDLSKSGRVHINRRFERWLGVTTGDGRMAECYDYTLEALRVLRGRQFDTRSLYDIALLRSSEDTPETGPRSFAGRCALEFYARQPKGLDGQAPPQTPMETLIGY